MLELVTKTWSMVKALSSSTLPNEGRAGDGREELLLKAVLEKADKTPESVMATMDSFAQSSWLMNIGDQKGAILVEHLKAANPKVVIELGAYVGYSATLIASNLKSEGKVISVEMSTDNANISRQVVNHAGLSDKVEIVNGVLTDKIKEIEEMVHAMNATVIDFVFLDHDKRFYLSDFLILKEHGLIGKGTVIFADNMGIPGSPLFRAYMNEHKEEFDTTELKTKFEYFNWLPDSILISTCKEIEPVDAKVH